MTITGGSALPKEEIDRMVKEAEEHAAEDKRRREEAELRNQLEQLVYQTEKVLKENADKVGEDVKKDVEDAVAEARKALEGAAVEAVRSAMTTLSTESQKIGQAIYSAASEGGQEEGAGASKEDEDIVDAEIVDEDESK